MTHERDAPETLPDLFWAVAHRLRSQARESLAPLAITPGQGRALGTLIHHGALRPGELAEHLRIAPRSATEVIDGLEALGMVERRRDPADRRAMRVVPTDTGRETARAIGEIRRAEAERIFGDLTSGDRDDLTRILRTLLAGH